MCGRRVTRRGLAAKNNAEFFAPAVMTRKGPIVEADCSRARSGDPSSGWGSPVTARGEGGAGERRCGIRSRSPPRGVVPSSAGSSSGATRSRRPGRSRAPRRPRPPPRLPPREAIIAPINPRRSTPGRTRPRPRRVRPRPRRTLHTLPRRERPRRRRRRRNGPSTRPRRRCTRRAGLGRGCR